MSNVDINVDRRTDGLTDERTENRTPISTLLQAGAIKIEFIELFVLQKHEIDPWRKDYTVQQLTGWSAVKKLFEDNKNYYWSSKILDLAIILFRLRHIFLLQSNYGEEKIRLLYTRSPAVTWSYMSRCQNEFLTTHHP